MRTWEQPCPSKTPKKLCLPWPEEPGRKSGLMDTASSISRRGPRTEVTPYLGHHLAPVRPRTAHATLRRFPPWSAATAISTLGRRLAGAAAADAGAGADLASSQQISAMRARAEATATTTQCREEAQCHRSNDASARFLPRPRLLLLWSCTCHRCPKREASRAQQALRVRSSASGAAIRMACSSVSPVPVPPRLLSGESGRSHQRPRGRARRGGDRAPAAVRGRHQRRSPAAWGVHAAARGLLGARDSGPTANFKPRGVPGAARLKISRTPHCCVGPCCRDRATCRRGRVAHVCSVDWAGRPCMMCWR